ncbi:MAG: hypothetical protein EOP83_09405 [Verrucomicrobiaceae bacterium]|nr:MAG: hypothetical protein EOP83_09405 [Verrucomicrobiaceae bacterium]
MRLDELTGVKRHKTRYLSDVLADFQAAGGSVSSGQYGTVLSMPKWSYVFKFFVSDDPYLRFVRWAVKNPSPFVPRFYGSARRITPFYMRGENTPQVYVVKMEKLEPITDLWLRENLQNLFMNPSMGRRAIEMFRDNRAGWAEMKAEMAQKKARLAELKQLRLRGERGSPDERFALQDWISENSEVAFFMTGFEQFPSLAGLLTYYWDVFLRAPMEDAHDIHANNIMHRPNGDLVLTDPLWEGGKSPEQEYQEMMRAEIGGYDDDYDPEYERFNYEHGPKKPSGYLMGGERFAKKPKRPKPKKQSAPVDYDNIPF